MNGPISRFQRQFWLTLTIALLPYCLPPASVAEAPPVAHVTVVADNPVAGIQALAKMRDASYQVFLWRAQNYLEAQLKGASFETMKEVLSKGGAVKISERNGDAWAEARYSIEARVLKGRILRAQSCVVTVKDFPTDNQTGVSISLTAEIGMSFKVAAARRDFPKGTVLDRVFGIIDLEKKARETPRLQSIEVSYDDIGYFSSPGLGRGFQLMVKLTDPSHHGRYAEQHASYMAVSGLDPLGLRYRVAMGQNNFAHVPRDTLIPGAALSDMREHDYPRTFGSTGSSAAGYPDSSPN